MAFWIFTGQLYYVITDSAKQLDIVSITAKVNSTLTYSPYLFEVFTIYTLRQNIKAGLLIELPDQFDQSLQPETISCFSSISKSIAVSCKRYNNTILAWKEDGSTFGLLQHLYIESLVNPAIANACTDASITNPNFKISLIDLVTNEVLATQVQPIKHLLLRYTTLPAPSTHITYGVTDSLG